STSSSSSATAASGVFLTASAASAKMMNGGSTNSNHRSTGSATWVTDFRKKTNPTSSTSAPPAGSTIRYGSAPGPLLPFGLSSANAWNLYNSQQNFIQTTSSPS
ncbi:unnamed protein product, partial [Amoebophrya sp. A120]